MGGESTGGHELVRWWRVGEGAMISAIRPRNAIASRSEPSAPFARNRSGAAASRRRPRRARSSLAASPSCRAPCRRGRGRAGRRACPAARDRQPVEDRCELRSKTEVDHGGEQRARRAVPLVEAGAVVELCVRHRQAELLELGLDGLRAGSGRPLLRHAQADLAREQLDPRLSLVLSSSPTSAAIGGDEILAISTASSGAFSRVALPPTSTPRASRSVASCCAAKVAGSSTGTGFGRSSENPPFTVSAPNGPT